MIPAGKVVTYERVNLKQFGWNNTIEEACAFRTLFEKDDSFCFADLVKACYTCVSISVQ